MVKPVRLDLGQSKEVFGNPVPLGLIGLAVGCVALVPSALGYGVTPAGLETAAVYALLFGAGCQLLAGLMCLANKNVLSGTVFTAFAFLWLINGWAYHSLAHGVVPDPSVGLATEIVLLVIFVALTYAFGFLSTLLFVFLVDIDLLFVARIVKSLTHTTVLDVPLAMFTIILAALALWLAFGALINPVVGRTLLPLGGALFTGSTPSTFDWGIRRNLFDLLYKQWREHAFQEVPLDTLTQQMREHVGDRSILPDLCYLQEFGYLKLTHVTDVSDDEPGNPTVKSVRLNAAGIDLYEQLVLSKYS